MTITIHRPIWLQRPAIWFGLAAILVTMTLAVLQDGKTDPADSRTANMPVGIVAVESTTYWKTLQSVQDNFLPPAETSGSAAYWKTLQLVQDDYLPPTVASGSAELEPNGLGDNRTNGPR